MEATLVTILSSIVEALEGASDDLLSADLPLMWLLRWAMLYMLASAFVRHDLSGQCSVGRTRERSGLL